MTLIKEWGFSNALIRQAIKNIGYQDEGALNYFEWICLNFYYRF